MKMIEIKGWINDTHSLDLSDIEDLVKDVKLGCDFMMVEIPDTKQLDGMVGPNGGTICLVWFKASGQVTDQQVAAEVTKKMHRI